MISALNLTDCHLCVLLITRPLTFKVRSTVGILYQSIVNIQQKEKKYSAKIVTIPHQNIVELFPWLKKNGKEPQLYEVWAYKSGETFPKF